MNFKFLGWAFCGLMLAGIAQAQDSAQPTPHASPIGGVESQQLASLLAKADALLKANKPAEAYALLEPGEGDYSGEIAYDYMLGVAALDSGNPDRAVIAFERALIVNPKFSGARMDMARAYFAMGSDDLARQEFETVLTQSPPEQVKGVVQKYLEAIQKRHDAKLRQVSAYLETNAGWDDNVSTVTSDFTKGVENTYGIPGVLPTGSSLMRAAMFAGVSGGVDYSRLVDETRGITLFMGADVRQRFYDGLSAMNSLNLDLRAGTSIARGDDTYRMFISLGQYRQAGLTAGTNGNRDTPAIGAEWRRSFGARDQASLLVQYSEPRYATQSTQDTNQVTLAASWLHAFDGKTNPLVFASLNRSNDQALNSMASGSNVSRTTTGARAYFQVTPLSGADVFLSFGFTARQDNSPNARSALVPAVYGRDLTEDTTLGVNVHFQSQWMVRGQVALFDNRSDLPLYQYHRTESSISLRRDF